MGRKRDSGRIDGQYYVATAEPYVVWWRRDLKIWSLQCQVGGHATRAVLCTPEQIFTV